MMAHVSNISLTHKLFMDPRVSLSCLDTSNSEEEGYFKTVQAFFDVLLIVLIIASNSFIIYSIIRFRSRHAVWNPTASGNSSVILVMNLSLAELLVGLASIYYLAFNYFCAVSSSIGYEKIACLTRYSLIFFSHLAAGGSVVCVSVDRYIAVVFPFQYSSYINSRSVKLMTAISWILALILSLIIFPWNNWETGKICLLEEIVPGWYVVMIGSLVYLVVALILMVIHFVIYRESVAFHRRNRSRESSKGSNESLTYRRKRCLSKSQEVLVMATVCYISCWVPFTVLAITRYEGLTSPVIALSFNLAFTVTHLNYIINPCVYAWKNKGVRRAMMKAVNSIYPKKVSVSTETSSVRPSIKTGSTNVSFSLDEGEVI